jgi:hypothetical protein
MKRLISQSIRKMRLNCAGLWDLRICLSIYDCGLSIYYRGIGWGSTPRVTGLNAVAWCVRGLDTGFYGVKKNLHTLVGKKFMSAGFSNRYPDSLLIQRR